MQRHPNTVIFITSTVPIRLYATNFDLLTNQTDTVTVLPDTMADKNYIITLPTASRRIYSSLQYHIIHFLPINFEIPTKIIIKISYKINKTVTFELTTTNSSKYIHYFAQSGTVSRLPRTYYIEASQPILITTALTCTPILSTAFAPSGCDFAAFMPPPIFKQGFFIQI
uniref:IgGFc-binding protein N-terminal domain-containing protein n=1 Tax=Panagrolaimus superbus TaxID=310955 RepID=A0A914Z476_9BILA